MNTNGVYIIGFRWVFFACILVNSIQGNAQTDKPNILVILTDDQGYHDVSFYGTADLNTPHIDALASDGMRLDNFYANSSVCSPTRAALLSGRYPGYVGVPGVIRTHEENNWGFLDPKVKLLPEILQQNDYHSALIGKWHLGLESPNTPNEKGFDYFHGWLGDMMDNYVEKRRHGVNYMRRNTETIDPVGHATDLFTDWSVNYIHEQAKDDRPFFLLLAYNAPHFPVQPPAEWLEKVNKREPRLTERRAKLVALIEHLDDGIGKVINALKESGQYENTLIIFTSDNGGLLTDEANNGPFRDGKQSMYEGGLRVPTVAVWKNRIKPNSSSDYMALSMDIFPTVAEAAGANINHAIEGISFLPYLLGNHQSDRDRAVFFERREGGERYGGLTIQSVRLNDWKLVHNSPFSSQELYNLKDDPYEKRNIIQDNPEKSEELNVLLRKHIQKAGGILWQKSDPISKF